MQTQMLAELLLIVNGTWCQNSPPPADLQKYKRCLALPQKELRKAQLYDDVLGHNACTLP